MTRATLSEARTLRRVIELFCAVSGQSINYSKSAVYFGKWVDARICRRISRFLSIKYVTMPCKYLDVFVGGK